MELRIVSGRFKNQLLVIKAADAAICRPTGQRVRDAAAQILGQRIVSARIGDFCAGSGSFGFEMLSRGAACVDFVEQDRRLLAALQENARRLKVLDECAFLRADVAAYIDACNKRYDIIYYDPPYEKSGLYALVPKVVLLLSASGVALVERRKTKNQSPENERIIEGMQHQSREYGDTVVDIYYR